MRLFVGLCLLASCVKTGHPLLTPKSLSTTIAVCPSIDAEHEAEFLEWVDVFRNLGCPEIDVHRSDCAAPPRPAEVQLRSCTDILVGPFGLGCPTDFGPGKKTLVDAVGIDPVTGAGVAYWDLKEHAPARAGHIVGHIHGMLDSTAGTSVMHPTARWPSTALVNCK